MPESPLIIVGVGESQLYAAAMLLQRFPDADLKIVSQKHLLDILKACGRQKGRTAYILGVPFSHDTQGISAAVAKAVGKGNRLIWIGYDRQRGTTGIEWEEHVVPSGETMVESVLRLAGSIPPNGVTRLLRSVARKVRDSDPLDSEGEETTDIVARAALWAATDLGNFGECRNGVLRLAGKCHGDDARSFDAIVNQYKLWGARRPTDHKSKAAKEIYRQARKVGEEGECRVLITGETGTGKETVARLIHACSPRMSKPFVAFNCADLSPQLLEGKLFGYRKGAFTGALQDYVGAFKKADGGTLFLDEVGELSPSAQAGLLRVLQEKQFAPLGNAKEIEVDVRVLAATNRDLREMVKNGQFREDLYYRLNAIVLHIPPLRERPEDIEAVFWSYWKRKPTEKELQVLCSHSWPGNIRELLSALDRARILHAGDLSKMLLHDEICPTESASESLDAAIRAHVQRIHSRYGQNNTRAAKALKISVNTLKKYLLGPE